MRKRKRKKIIWPFPPGVGEDIPREFKKYHIPKDDYYYLAFPLSNSQIETEENLKLLAEKGLPFEYSKSPSGAICYRIHRRYETLPDIQMELGSRDTVPIGMPARQYGKDVFWRLSQQNYLGFLFTKWTPIKPDRRKRKKQPAEENTRRRRKKN